MAMLVVADIMEQIAAVLTATSAVAFVSSLRPDPAPGRRLRLAGLALASVLLLAHAALARSVATGAFAGSGDLPTLAWLLQHRTAPLTWLFTQISVGGGTIAMAVLATLGSVTLWVRHRRRAAMGLVGATLGSALLVVVFKDAYHRGRPPLDVQVVPQSSLSFPSGHALGSIVVIGMVSILIGTGLRSPRLRGVLAVLAVAAVVMIGLSRLYLGVHWLSDVLAGWSLGGGWLVLCAVITVPYRRPAPPGPPIRPARHGPDDVPVDRYQIPDTSTEHL